MSSKLLVDGNCPLFGFSGGELYLGCCTVKSVTVPCICVCVALLFCVVLKDSIVPSDYPLGSLSFVTKSSPDNNMCNENDSIIPGTWERIDLSEQSFNCCEYDNCTEGNLFPCNTNRCDANQAGPIVHKREKYQWHPANCNLLQWNGSQFCSLLRNRTILLIGDSTMHQSAGTLTSMIDQWFRHHTEKDEVSCAAQIILRLSDFLTVSHDVAVVGATNYYRGSERERGASVSEHIREVNPDIVIITAGAHFMNAAVFMDTLKKVIGDARKILRLRHEAREKAAVEQDELSDISHMTGNDNNSIEEYGELLDSEGMGKSKKHIKFIWKSQNPAHLNCFKEVQPYFDFKSAIRNAEVVQPEIDKYFWHMHPKFDRIAAHLLQDTPIKFLDMRPLYLRPDAHHGDVSLNEECLHYCLPGPLNLFAIQLLHFLQHHGI